MRFIYKDMMINLDGRLWSGAGNCVFRCFCGLGHLSIEHCGKNPSACLCIPRICCLRRTGNCHAIKMCLSIGFRPGRSSGLSAAAKETSDPLCSFLVAFSMKLTIAIVLRWPRSWRGRVVGMKGSRYAPSRWLETQKEMKNSHQNSVVWSGRAGVKAWGKHSQGNFPSCCSVCVKICGWSCESRRSSWNCFGLT